MTTDHNTESQRFEQNARTTDDREINSEEQIIRKSVIRLNGQILGIIIGIIGSLVIFVATNWLVIKGGEVVGPHLSLLGQFFIGYSVTFVGSLIGAAYGFVIGYLSGLLVGWIYNTVVFLRKSKSQKL